jgi:Mg2+/citrate symporter
MGFLTSVEEFVLTVADSLGLSPIWVALLLGGVVFSLVAGVVGRISHRFGVWRTQAEAADRPQTATTSRTPRQVVQQSCAARVRLLFWKLVIFVALLVALLIWLGLLDEVLLFIQEVLWPAR